MKWVNGSGAGGRRRVLGAMIVAATALLGTTGCATVVEPGHRALLFDPRHGGLAHDVLNPGRHRHSYYARLDDFDVTYSTRKEELQTNSSEGLALHLKVAVIYRPIVSELYELDTEIGPSYYDEVVGPEFRSAARGVFARHSYQELHAKNDKIEDEVEIEVRRRVSGKHVEISSVTMEEVLYAPEIANAIREKLVGAEEAARRKTAQENDDLRLKQSLLHEAENAKTRAAQQVLAKQTERELTEQQAAIDKAKAEAQAAIRVTNARAEAEEAKLMAAAHAEENKAQRHTLTALTVMDHAYEALGKLGGSGTAIMLGDWSKVPSFLIPQIPAFKNALNSAAPVASTDRGE